MTSGTRVVRCSSPPTISRRPTKSPTASRNDPQPWQGRGERPAPLSGRGYPAAPLSPTYRIACGAFRRGVTEVDVCGTGVSIDSLDADSTIRDLVVRGVPFRDLEVTGAGLEQAFVALTGCGAAKASVADAGNPAKAASTASLVQREL